MSNYNSYVKIESSVIPNVYPDDTFIDRYYTLNRVVRDGFYDEILITSEKFKTLQDNFYKERNVQSLIYKKYYIKLFAKESTNINLLKYADVVTIILQNNEVHIAKILSITTEKAGTTQGIIYTISYADINSDNYNDSSQAVSNYLRSDTLIDRFGLSQVNRITFANSNIDDSFWESIGKTKDVYTLLMNESLTADLQESTQNLNGLIYASRQIAQQTKKLRFYTNEADAQIVQTYLPLCNDVTFRVSTSIYSSFERTIPSVQKLEGVDLFQIDIEIKDTNIIINQYN